MVYMIASIFLQVCIIGAFGLRDIYIKVPEAVRAGDSVTLACDYDLEQVALYSIKWYRFEEEFYRFVPKEVPPTKVFQMPHLNIDVSRSNSREVTLNSVERETSGEFKCEVSADAPFFHTEIRSANLLVADVPEDGPILTTEVTKVALGARIMANCTSPPSFPAMNISWFVNDLELHPAPNFEIGQTFLRYDALPDLESTHSTVSLKANQELFIGGKLKLRCLATIFSLYRRTEELEVQEDTPLLALVMVPATQTIKGSSGGSRHSPSLPALGTAALLLFKKYVCL